MAIKKGDEGGMKGQRGRPGVLLRIPWDESADDPKSSELNALRWKTLCAILGAWRALDPAPFRELLTENHEYGSYWVLARMHGRNTYCEYITGKFQAIREGLSRGDTAPAASVVSIQMGITLQADHYRYALHIGQGDVETLLTFRFEKGGARIASMYMMAPDLYTFLPVDVATEG